MVTILRSRGQAPSLTELGIERVSWDDLGPAFLDQWGRPGGKFEPEHLTVYGKSGGGKSYFVGYVLDARARFRGSHVCIVATKPTDKTLVNLRWPILETYPPPYGVHQFIYWAKAKGLSAAQRAPQKVKVARLMNSLWTPKSNIIVYWDELPYIEKDLGLRVPIETYYREGRALGITNVASMQRPSGVTRHAHSDAGWTVAFPPKDADDRKRVAQVLGDQARFQYALDLLDRQRYEFVIRHDLTGETYVSHLPSPRVRSSANRRVKGG